MKYATISVKYYEAKARALGYYLSKKDSSTEAELLKTLEVLYEKYVPKDARELIEWQAAAEPSRPVRSHSAATASENPGQGGDT